MKKMYKATLYSTGTTTTLSRKDIKLDGQKLDLKIDAIRKGHTFLLSEFWEMIPSSSSSSSSASGRREERAE